MGTERVAGGGGQDAGRGIMMLVHGKARLPGRVLAGLYL